MNCLVIMLMSFIIEVYCEQNMEGLTGYVVGGVDVPIFMYPHVAQLFLDKNLCGGSVISNRVILTAAHCLFNRIGRLRKPRDVSVYLGSSSLKEGAKYDVCKMVPHENYAGHLYEPYYYYDLGLILLINNIHFGPSVRTVNIGSTEEFRNEKYSFTIAGFGAISSLFPSGPSRTLKASRMYYVDSKKCNESQSYRNDMYVPDHMFCMIGLGWASDCYGDSGSAILWRRSLVGIVATGRDDFCGSDMLPSMYTDVVYFRKWVTEKVIELESLPAGKCGRNSKNYNRQKSRALAPHPLRYANKKMLNNSRPTRININNGFYKKQIEINFS